MAKLLLNKEGKILASNGKILMVKKESSSGGSSGSSGVIEVTELPETGEEGKVYVIQKQDYTMWVYGDGNIFNFTEMNAQDGLNVSCTKVETLPTENISISDMQTTLVLYYVPNDNDIYCYGPFTSENNEWVSFFTMLGGDKTSFKGVVEDPNSALSNENDICLTENNTTMAYVYQNDEWLGTLPKQEISITPTYEEIEVTPANGYNLAKVIVAPSTRELEYELLRGSLENYSNETTQYGKNYCLACMSNLKSVELSSMIHCGFYAFYNCVNLLNVNLPKATIVPVSAFEKCYLLERVDLGGSTISGIETDAFKMCYSLKTLILRNTSTIPYLNSSTFSDCYHFTGAVNATYNPSGLKDGRIYVPDNMVDTLKSATNWSTYADIIVPLSTLVEE